MMPSANPVLSPVHCLNGVESTAIIGHLPSLVNWHHSLLRCWELPVPCLVFYRPGFECPEHLQFAGHCWHKLSVAFAGLVSLGSHSSTLAFGYHGLQDTASSQDTQDSSLACLLVIGGIQDAVMLLPLAWHLGFRGFMSLCFSCVLLIGASRICFW